MMFGLVIREVVLILEAMSILIQPMLTFGTLDFMKQEEKILRLQLIWYLTQLGKNRFTMSVIPKELLSTWYYVWHKSWWCFKQTNLDTEWGVAFNNSYLQIMLSERPEYNNKVKAGFLLAPVAFMTHSTNSVFLIAEWGEGRNVL